MAASASLALMGKTDDEWSKADLKIYLKMQVGRTEVENALRALKYLRHCKAARHLKEITRPMWGVSPAILASPETFNWWLTHFRSGQDEVILSDAIRMATQVGQIIDLNGGWPHIKRQHKAFAEELHRREMEKQNAPFDNEWLTITEDQEHCVELVHCKDRVSLLEEGEALEHCVGGATYQDRCKNGTSSIYSVRVGGERKATLELRRKADGTMFIHQMRGWDNADQEDTLWLIVGQLVDVNNEQEKDASTSLQEVPS